MRKIILALLTFIGLTSVCYAEVKMPTDPRWLFCDGKHGVHEIWVDINTVKYGPCKHIGVEHRKHKGVIYWSRILDYEKDIELNTLQEMDLECGIERPLNGIMMDGNGKTIEKADHISPNIRYIYPETVAEIIQKHLLQVSPYNKNKKDASKALLIWQMDTNIYRQEVEKK